jgi:O-antigen/teichoic acid export membrane protein
MDPSELKSVEYELKKITREAGISFAGVLLGMGLKYICVIVIARHLGVLGFGAYVFGLTILNFGQVLSVAGLNYGVLQYVSVSHSQKERERTKGFILSALKLVLIGALLVGMILLSGRSHCKQSVLEERIEPGDQVV